MVQYRDILSELGSAPIQPGCPLLFAVEYLPSLPRPYRLEKIYRMSGRPGELPESEDRICRLSSGGNCEGPQVDNGQSNLHHVCISSRVHRRYCYYSYMYLNIVAY